MPLFFLFKNYLCSLVKRGKICYTNMLVIRLSIKWKNFFGGKEECARETQEGCPA